MGKARSMNWREASPLPVILISGAEEHLAQRAIRSIRDQLKNRDSGLEIHELQASDYTPGQLSALASPSLFMEPRLIIISGVEKCSDALIEDGLAFVEAPTLETTLILRHNSSSVRGKKLIDALRSNDSAAEIVCAEIKKDSERADFIQAEFASASRKITPGAVRALSDAFSDDLSELSAACSQLLADQADAIDEEVVDKYYGEELKPTPSRLRTPL